MNSPEPPPQEELPPRETSLSVLLIEDNPGDARLFEEYLDESSPAFDLRHELTLEAGLEALRGETPDVLAVDLGLPDSEGAETVKAVAGVAPSIPIVVLTGQDDLQAALQAQEAGAAEYLQKDELTPALAGRTLRWATRQARMQRKLRQRDAWIRSISENVAGGLFRIGPTGRIEYANRALAHMLGFEEEAELIGRDLTAFYANPVQQGRMLAEEGANGVEVELERTDGTVLIGLLSAEAAYDAEGQVLHYDGVITDITERAEQRQRLRMLSEAVEQAREAVLITEPEPLDEPGPRIEYVNAAFEEMTGYSEEEVLGQTPRILQGPETEREVLDSLRAALETGEEWEGETVNYTKDGEPYRVRWNVSPVTNASGEIEHWVSVQRDVTEERKREKRLSQMAQALDQVGDKVVITDREGHIQYVNAAFEEMTGYSEEEVLGQTPAVLQSGEHDEAFYEELWDTVRSGETFRAEFVNEKKDGTRYVEDERISPVRNEEGEITHFVSSGRDVTERKEREEELRRRKNLLEQTQRLAGAWEADLRSGELSWSNEVYRIHELDPGTEIEVGDWIEFYAPEAWPKIREAFERCVEEGKPYDLELPLVTAEGTRRWVRTVGAPAEKEDGEVVKVAGAFQDITDRKEAEQALRRSEKLHRLAVEAAEVGTWDLNLETGECFLSTMMVSLMGYEADEFRAPEGYWQQMVPQSAWLASVHPEDRSIMEDNLAAAMEEGVPLDLEFRIKTKEGALRWLYSKGDVTRAQDGTLHLHGASLDITEQKEAQRALAEREEYLSVTLQSIGDAVVATDRDGYVTEMNAVAERLTGWNQEEAEGQLLDDILTLHSARTGETVENPAEEVLRDGTTVGLANHTVLTSRDGTEYQIADSAAPIQSEEGDLLGVVMVFRDVTEKYEQRRRMKRQNDLFSKTQDLAGVGGWEYDVETGVHSWTEEVYRIYGLPKSFDPTVQEGIAHYHPDDRPTIRELFTRAVEEGEPYDIELRLLSADGEEKWVRTRGEPQVEDGEIVRVRGSIQDITERKNREIRLEEMQDRMELALDHTRSIVFEIDLETDQVSRIGAYEEFFGRTSEEIRTREEHINRAVHPDDRADFRDFYREMARGERTSGTLEYRTNPDVGDVRWIRDHVHRIEGTDRLLGLARDITDRKERRERLRLLAEAIEQVGDKVVITDSDGRIEFVNEAFRQITGYAAEEVRGKTPNVLKSDRHDEPFYADLWDTITAGETFRAEIVNERKDGTTYVEDETISPVVDEDGNVTHFVSTGRDVTDRKEREQELVEAKEEAEEANRLKSAFLANMSHEIRTPLTSILGFAEAIGEETQDAEEPGEVDLGTLSQFSELIQKSGRRLMETLDLVLNLSRLEAGEMDLKLEPVDLGAEAEEIAEQFALQAEEAGVDLSTDLPENPAWARADAGGVRIVLRNLISNAIKYTEAGGTAELRVYTEAEGALLEVEDTGIGMNPSRAQELFEAFKQESEGVAREYEGSGLGLTVTEKVLSEMGGAISVETAKGEGTRFTVRLPQPAEKGG